MEKNKQNNSAKPELKMATPIIIKAISFFLIFASAIAILFYAYVLIFNSNVLSEEISLVVNPFLSIKNYILLEILLFVLLIVGVVFMLYSKRKGVLIISASLVLLLIMNLVYFEKVDWFNSSMTAVILLILIFSWKKIK